MRPVIWSKTSTVAGQAEACGDPVVAGEVAAGDVTGGVAKAIAVSEGESIK